MANSLVAQIITDGPRNATVKIAGLLDTSDLSLTNVVLPSNFSPTPPRFRVDYLDYSISDGIEVQLLWTAAVDTIIVPLAGRGRMDFTSFGGLTNNAGTGVTGGIDIKTTGWAAGVYAITLVLELVKQGL